jgi:hypothetical protein
MNFDNLRLHQARYNNSDISTANNFYNLIQQHDTSMPTASADDIKILKQPYFMPQLR